jgi:hypothetical protein
MKLLNKLILIFLFCINFQCTLFDIFFSGESDGVVLFGFMDKKGNETIPPKYKMAHPFKEDLASVKAENDLWGFIDKNGKLIIDPTFFDAANFSEGLVAVKINNAYIGKNWGYSNKKGEIVIQPLYYSAGEFKNGIARVTFEYTNRSGFANHLHGYIDKHGSIVTRDDDRTTSLEKENHYYSDGLFPVKTSDGWSFKNNKGELITKESFYEVRSFSEGMAAVAINIDSPDTLKKFSKFIVGIPGDILNGISGTNTVVLWGYIDTTGKLVIPYSYLQANPFMNGFAVVNNLKVDPVGMNGYFYINKKGENQFNTTYEFAKSFSSDLASVTTMRDDKGNTKSYYINSSGKIALDLIKGNEFLNCEPFSDGVAFVRTREMTQKNPEEFATFTYYEGFIDPKGNPIYPLYLQKNFDAPRSFSNGMALFNRYFKK